MDTRPAAANDDLALSVDYDALSQCLATFAEHSRFQLLEALAGGLAEQVLQFSPLISAVTIRLDKPQALPKADCASVQIRRVRACSTTKK